MNYLSAVKLTGKSKLFLFHGLFILLIQPFVFVSTSLAESRTQIIVSTGTGTPDENGLFLSPGIPAINSFGAVLFGSSLYDTSEGNDDNSGIYRTTVSNASSTIGVVREIREIARENSLLSIGGNSYRVSSFNGILLRDAPAINGFSPPASGGFKDVAFGFSIDVNEDGIDDKTFLVIENSGSLSFATSTGSPVASGNGSYEKFNLVSLNATNSALIFSAKLEGTSGDDDNTAIFRKSADGGISEIVRRGDAMPGASGLISNLFTGQLSSNDTDDFIYIATDDSGETIPEGTSVLYRVIDGGSSEYMVAEGDVVPIDDVDTRIFSSLLSSRINNNHVVGFIARFRYEDGLPSPSTGLFTVGDSITVDGSAAVTPIVLEDQLTPDGTALYKDLADVFLGGSVRPTFNDLGQFAISVDLSLVDPPDEQSNAGEQSSGVFRVAENDIVEIARRGDAYEEGTLRNFLAPAINNHGLVAFKANLALEIIPGSESGIPVLDDILIYSDGQDYATVARTGQQFGSKTLLWISFSADLGLNDHGVIAYKAHYTDTTSSVNVWQPEIDWRAGSSDGNNDGNNDGNWDDSDNWSFGEKPNLNTSLELDPAYNLSIQGPLQATEISSLVLGGGDGVVKLILAAGTLTINDGLVIKALSAIEGKGILEAATENLGTIEVAENETFQIKGDVINSGNIVLGENSQITFTDSFLGHETIHGSNGDVVFNGELILGESPERLTVEGNVTLGGENTSLLKVSGLARGEGYDALDVVGTLTLGGTLDIQLSNALSLKVGDTFLLLQANNIEGEFNAINLPEIDSQNIQLVVNKTSQKFEIEVQALEGGDSKGGSSGSLSWMLLSLLLLMFKCLRHSFHTDARVFCEREIIKVREK